MNLKLWILAIALVPAVAFGDEASVKRALEARLGGVTVDRVSKTPYLNLYEAVIGDEIVYTDEKANYIFSGSIIDAKTRRNLTEERMRKLSAIRFDELPLADAIKTVRGNGKRVIATFEDPNCPYCKRLWKDLARMDNITVYTFLYPILSPDSVVKAKAIWCAKDRSRAWVDHMVNGADPTLSVDCNTPIEKNLALGRKLRVTGTPTTFFTNGERLVGAQPEELVRMLDQSPAR